MCEAHFWFAPGVEIGSGQVVPSVSGAPPSRIRIVLREPFDAVLTDLPPAPSAPMPQTAEFRLTAWGVGGDVAHYDLDSQPPPGWRWLAINDRIHAERVSGRAPHSEGGPP